MNAVDSSLVIVARAVEAAYEADEPEIPAARREKREDTGPAWTPRSAVEPANAAPVKEKRKLAEPEAA
jgi:hypothetical protein